MTWRRAHPQPAAADLLERRRDERRLRPRGVRLRLDARDGERSRPRAASREPRARGLVEDGDVVALRSGRASRSPGLPATRWPSTATSDAVNAGSVGNGGLEVPVAGRRRTPCARARARTTSRTRGRLHPTGGQALADLAPAHLGHRVAVEPVDDAPALLRVDEAVVDVAATRRWRAAIAAWVISWNTIRFTGTRRLQHLEQVPRDRFAFAVLIRREIELVGTACSAFFSSLMICLLVGVDLVLDREAVARCRRSGPWPAGPGRGPSTPCTVKSPPRKPAMVRALAGDSTITRGLGIGSTGRGLNAVLSTRRLGSVAAQGIEQARRGSTVLSAVVNVAEAAGERGARRGAGRRRGTCSTSASRRPPHTSGPT